MQEKTDISYALPTGFTLKNNTYTIQKVIGAGGMGITYLATKKADTAFEEDEQLVIKELFITPNNTNSHCTRNHQNNCTVIPEGKLKQSFKDFKERFYKEAKTLHKFRNLQAMVQVKDLFEENDTVYFTMQYINGQTLQDLVQQNGKLNLKETIKYLEKVGKLLHNIHKENFLHRDVKPENILIDKQGNAFLIDFGIAKGYDDLGIVKTLTAMGTKRYAPPEQLAGEKELITEAIDVYGLANTFYYCLTGTAPQTSDEISYQGEKTLKDLLPNTNDKLNTCIEKARKRNPKLRTKTINAFLNELNAIASSNTNKQTIIEQEENTVIEVTPLNFDEIVIKNNDIVLVYFYASWISSHQSLIGETINKLDNFVNSFNGLFVKIDIETDEEYYDKYYQGAIPKILIFENGAIIKEFTGVDEINDSIKKIKSIYSKRHNLNTCENTIVETETDFTGKPAQWFNTRERRLLWWNNLEPQWKKAFNEILSGKTTTAKLNDQQLQTLFAKKEINLIGKEGYLSEEQETEGMKNLTFKLTNLSGLKNLTYLEHLDCSDNQLSSLKGIENLIDLKLLHCVNNQISSLEVFKNLINVEVLAFYGNKLSSLEGIRNLTNLKVLGCSSNKLSSLDGIENLTNLKLLKCSSNQLNSIKGIDNLINVRYLLFYDNQLNSLRPLQTLLNKIKPKNFEINVISNPIREVSAGFWSSINEAEHIKKEYPWITIDY